MIAKWLKVFAMLFFVSQGLIALVYGGYNAVDWVLTAGND
jgi:hypothetical protein